MLNITFVDSYRDVPLHTIRDAEREFAFRGLTVTDTSKRLIQKIEKAVLYDDGTIIDRFEYRIYSSDLSTGCKTALLVNEGYPPVSLEGCGYNAIDDIINYCSGEVVVKTPRDDFSELDTGNLPVFCVKGIKIKGVENLNRYLDGEFDEN